MEKTLELIFTKSDGAKKTLSIADPREDVTLAEAQAAAASNFGFPMVLSWYLLLRMEQRLDRLTHCLNELSRAIISKEKEGQ